MLKIKAKGQEMRFYGKTTKSEFAWFVIFGGFLCMFGLMIILHALLFYPHNRQILFSSIGSLFRVFIIISPLGILSIVILYWGYLLRSENVNGGENAATEVNRGGKRRR